MQALITIDVEAHRGLDPINTFVWGKTKKGYFGLKLIVEELKNNNLIGLFFVDFAEIYDYGEKPIQEIVSFLLQEGMEIGVHLHPDHFGDKQRTFLWEYSYEEQFNMIQRVTNDYIRLVGKQPMFFRAGKYGANDETIDILQKLGYLVDSSELKFHKWCHISHNSNSNCLYQIRNDLLELPVTIFESFSLLSKKRYDQLDLGNCCSEFKRIINAFIANRTDNMVTLFFHSFSFFPARKNPDNIKASRFAIKTFKKNVSFLVENKIEVINPKDFRLYLNSEQHSFLPKSGYFFRQYAYLFCRSILIMNWNRKAFLFVILNYLLLLVFIAIIAVLFVFLIWK